MQKNNIYSPNGVKPMGVDRLSKWWGNLNEFYAGQMYDMSRLKGDLCSCNGNGEFELYPLDSDEVKDGGKHYMRCRVCGDNTHL